MINKVPGSENKIIKQLDCIILQVNYTKHKSPVIHEDLHLISKYRDIMAIKVTSFDQTVGSISEFDGWAF